MHDDSTDPEMDARRRMADVTGRHTLGDLPDSVRAITEAHQRKLAQLIRTLRRAGVDEDLVRHSIREVISSYEDELVGALAAMRGTDR